MRDSIDTRLRQYVTPQAPLGPSDASQITDIEVAARLFDPHNKSFNSLLRKDLSVVIGRRGSGKTALLTSYKYRPYLVGNIEPDTFGADFSAYDLVIEVKTYKDFEEMQTRVVKDPNTFRPIESIVEDWATLILDYFLAKLVAEETTSSRRAANNSHLLAIQNYLRQDESAIEDEVRKAVWGQSLWGRIKTFGRGKKSDEREFLPQEEVMRRAVEYLKSEKKRAVITFDSMDEYDIGRPAFNRTVGALVRFIAHFNTRYDRIKIKLVLPSEIFPEIQEASGNPLKDLVSYDQVQWSSMELMQIAAYRYKLFLSLYDPEYCHELRKLDLNRRDDVHQFWSRFFPTKHTNRYGVEEDAMTYVLRHTQLLPRQLLMILQRIVVNSRRLTGGYREFKESVVRNVIEEMEPVIAGEIFGAFRHIYPFAKDIGKSVFGNLPTILTYNQLEDQWRKRARHQMSKLNTDFEMVHFSEMLIRMGIIGIVKGETQRYYEAQFGYHLLTPFNIGDGNLLCIHPIFSKYFNAAGNDKSKAISPQGTTIDM